jgi:hypothetical protein
MPILTMAMGQGPELLLPYEDEHMKLAWPLSFLLFAYPMMRKSTCKPCLSGQESQHNMAQHVMC